MLDRSAQAYWAANVRLLSMCLVIWFIVSFGFGILLVDQLNGNCSAPYFL